VNTNGYYAPMLEMLERSIAGHFMDERHRAMWLVVDEPDHVLDAIHNSPPWSTANRSFAAS
jgi:predicted Rossmann-fold nucleotide-binding protein